MKPTSETISRNPTGLDFRVLREEGLRHLGQFSGDLWTDHNTHDPGITILEALIFALLDLDYRTSDDIKNLLAADPALGSEAAAAQFFTAKEILGCNPLTENDFRKVLLDIPGVRNAWLEPTTTTEPPIFVNCENGHENALDFEKSAEFQSKSLPLNGLWRVWIQPEAIRPQDESASGCDATAQNSLDRILEEVHRRLAALRNLCEDFVEIRFLQEEQIGLCSAIEIDPTLQPEAVLTDLLTRLEGFLSPVIPFFSLKEMVEKGFSTEEIFEGRPLLTSPSHGFIAPADLDRPRPMVLHVSDFYQIMLDTPGVRAVRNLKLSSFVAGQPRSQNQSWQLPLSEGFFPVLSPELSQFALLKDGIQQPFDLKKVADRFRARLTAAEKTIRKPYELDQLPPDGEFRADLGEFISIQHDFPLVYGIGPGGLAADAPLVRHAQALQLKGYLLFFDQFLANYLAQLATAREAFFLKKTTTPPAAAADLAVKSMASVPRLNELILGADPQPEGDDLTGSGRLYRLGDVLVFPIKPDATTDDFLKSHRFFDSPASRDLILRRTMAALENHDFEVNLVEKPNGRLRFDLVFSFEMPANAAPLVLRSMADFKNENEARLEAQSLTFLGLQAENFQKTDRPDEAHYSFTLAYQPLNYADFLEKINAPSYAARARRTALLNHLLARFGEDFSEYALLAFAASQGADLADSILDDQTVFLQNYAEISQNRGRGFDYSLKNELWDSKNVTGLETRVAGLMGIDDWTRHTLSPFSVIEKTIGEPLIWRDWSGQPMLESVKKYTTKPTDGERAAIFETWKKAFEKPENCRPLDCDDWNLYSFELLENECVVARCPQSFGSKALRDSKKQYIAALFQKNGWDVFYPKTAAGWVFQLKNPSDSSQILLESATPDATEPLARLRWIEARNRAQSLENFRFQENPLGNGWSFFLAAADETALAEPPTRFFETKTAAETAVTALVGLFSNQKLEARVSARPEVWSWQLTDGAGCVLLESLYPFETEPQAALAFCEALKLACDDSNFERTTDPTTGKPTYFLQKTWPVEPENPSETIRLAAPKQSFDDEKAVEKTIEKTRTTAQKEREKTGKIRVKANALRPILKNPSSSETLLRGLETFPDLSSLEIAWPRLLSCAADLKNYDTRSTDDGFELALLDENGHDLALAPCFFYSKSEVDDFLETIKTTLVFQKPTLETESLDEAFSWLLTDENEAVILAADRWFESKRAARAARFEAIFAARSGGLQVFGTEKIQLLNADGERLGQSLESFSSNSTRTARLDSWRDWFECEKIKPRLLRCAGAWFFEIKKDGCLVFQNPTDFETKNEALLALDSTLDAAACSLDFYEFLNAEDGCFFSFQVKNQEKTAVLATHPIFNESPTMAQAAASELAEWLCGFKMNVVFEAQNEQFHWEFCFETCDEKVETWLVGAQFFEMQPPSDECADPLDAALDEAQKAFEAEILGPLALKETPNGWTFFLSKKDEPTAVVATHPRFYTTENEAKYALDEFEIFRKWHPTWASLGWSAAVKSARFHLEKPESVGIFHRFYQKSAQRDAALRASVEAFECCRPVFSTLDFDSSVVKKQAAGKWFFQLKTGAKIWWQSAKAWPSAAEAQAAFDENWRAILATAALGFFETNCDDDGPCFFFLLDSAGEKWVCSPDFEAKTDLETEFRERLRMAQTYPIFKNATAENEPDSFGWQLFDFEKQESIFTSATDFPTAEAAQIGFERFLELARHEANFWPIDHDLTSRFGFEIREATLDEVVSKTQNEADSWSNLDEMLSKLGDSIQFEQAMEPSAGCRFQLFLADERWRVARACAVFHSPSAREQGRDALFQKMKCASKPTIWVLEKGFLNAEPLCQFWNLDSLELPENDCLSEIKSKLSESGRPLEATAVVDLMNLARSADFYFQIGEPNGGLRLGLFDEKNRLLLVGAALFSNESDWETARNAAIEQAWSFPVVRDGDGFGFQWAEKQDDDWAVVFEHARVFDSPEAAFEEFKKWLVLVKDRSNFNRTERSNCGPFGLEITDPQAVLATHSATYALRSEWLAAKKRLENCLHAEGFHLVEHILLRPQATGDALLPTCLPENWDCRAADFEQHDPPPGVDPYSFWATVVVPYWSPRFRSVPFRQFFEKTLRQEAPAHVVLRIAWVEAEAMQVFEKNYRAWLESKADGPDSCRRTGALSGLLHAMDALRNRYPTTAQLFGGKASDGQTIVLDETNLS